MNISLNKKQKLYIIPCGNGVSCLGFDRLEQLGTALAKELKLEWNNKPPSIKKYKLYQSLCDEVLKRNKDTGFKSSSQLTPQLIGLEGKRVKVIDKYDETRAFKVGKSTGYIPCHLELKRSDSTGGCAVCGTPFKSITIIG